MGLPAAKVTLAHLAFSLSGGVSLPPVRQRANDYFPEVAVAKPRPKHHEHAPRHLTACEVCGEPAKTHRVKLAIDGKGVAAWRCCASCMALKVVAAFGKGPTGVHLASITPVRPLKVLG